MSMYPCLFGGGSAPATLITKSITQNGIYNAQDDNADGYSSVSVNVGASLPVLISLQSKNRSSSNVLSYTFTESGTFQYYIFATSDTLLSSSDLTIQLNGNSLTPQSVVVTYGGLFYNEIVVAAGDVITADITRANNRGMQLYIFKDSDISRANVIGYAGNDGSTFTINVSEGMPFVETYYCGYYSGNNYYSYFVGIAPSSSLALKSIPTPNQSTYWYGGTCVFTI